MDIRLTKYSAQRMFLPAPPYLLLPPPYIHNMKIHFYPFLPSHRITFRLYNPENNHPSGKKASGLYNPEGNYKF